MALIACDQVKLTSAAMPTSARGGVGLRDVGNRDVGNRDVEPNAAMGDRRQDARQGISIGCAEHVR
jgi:hypothetical protein